MTEKTNDKDSQIKIYIGSANERTRNYPNRLDESVRNVRPVSDTLKPPPPPKKGK